MPQHCMSGGYRSKEQQEKTIVMSADIHHQHKMTPMGLSYIVEYCHSKPLIVYVRHFLLLLMFSEYTRGLCRYEIFLNLRHSNDNFFSLFRQLFLFRKTDLLFIVIILLKSSYNFNLKFIFNNTFLQNNF